jgi:hypothetical protein
MKLEKFEKFIENLKKSPIYEVGYPKHKSNKNLEFDFDIGKPILITNARHSGDHGFGKFKKYLNMINQEYFSMSINKEIRITIFGCWELKYNGKTLIDYKTDEDKIEELFNFIFQGHKINDIKVSNEKIIIIVFSNNMELIITRENNIDGLLYIQFGDTLFGLSNNEGIIEKSKTENKFLKWFEYLNSEK